MPSGKNEKWPIFTTRPDTIFGVTFLVVSAQHPRLDELVEKNQKEVCQVNATDARDDD